MDPVLGAGALSFAGGMWANMQNLAESKRAREWSAVMAGSEVQRRMIDMKAAGLNPILAAGGAASTPGASTSSVDDVVSPAVSTALQVRRQRAELQLLEQQTEKAASEAAVARGEEQKYQWGRQFYFDQEGRPTAKFRELIQAEHDGKLASSARAISDAQFAKFSVPEQEAIGRLFQEVGGGGKALQLLLPILSTAVRRR